MADKVESLLATLRGESPEPAAEALPALEAAASGGAPADPAALSEALAPLQQKLAELEAKLGELAAPPALAAPEQGEAPPPEPPQPPTELSIFLQTRMELLERKLEAAQQEALRAGLLLREREQAQRKAQGEVEDLFRSIREQQRAASFDRALRDQYAKTQERARELERRLALAELRMLPAEEVARHLATEEGRAELARRIQEQLAKAGAAPAQDPPAAAVTAPGAKPPPLPEFLVETSASSLDQQTAVLLGRITDLERRLEESEKARDTERAGQRRREEEILAALQTTRRQYQKAGGPELLVEATLETMVESLRRRETLEREQRAALSALEGEPDAAKAAGLRARLAELQGAMRDLQERIDKQTAIVQAWIERHKGLP